VRGGGGGGGSVFNSFVGAWRAARGVCAWKVGI